MTNAQRKKNKYRTDPEFRTKSLARAKAQYQIIKNDPIKKKIRKLDNLIYWRRQQIENWLRKVSNLEKSLIRFIKIREELRNDTSKY